MKQLTFLTKIILVALFLCLNITAQTSETQKTQTAEEKQKEIEVRKFLASFIKEMDEKKDIRQIPEQFFAAHFKKRFTTLIFFYDDLPKELTEDARYQGSLEIFNVMYQGLICMYGSEFNFDSSENEKDSEFLKKFLPPDVFKIAKNNKFLNALMEDKSDDIIEKEIKEASQINQLISDLHLINEALRKYIGEQNLKWFETYQKEAAKRQAENDYYHARKCEKDDCKGLTPNTIIYHLDSNPFCVEIVEDAGSYKILDIYLRMD